jgi:hypothetical protein
MDGNRGQRLIPTRNRKAWPNDKKNASLVAGKMWKSTGISEQLSVKLNELHIRAFEV